MIAACKSPSAAPGARVFPADPDRPLGPYTRPPARSYDAGHDLEQLRGAMCGDYFDQQNFADLRAMGANLVRWHVGFEYPEKIDASVFEDPSAYPEWLEEGIAKAEIAAAECERLGMLMVIDLPVTFSGDPSGPATVGNPVFSRKDSRETFIRVWESFAKRFKGSRAVWAFELLNEPLVPRLPGPLEKDSGRADDAWNDLFVETTERIRAIDPERFVIYDPILGCNPYSYVDFSPLPIDKVIYTVHMYTPYRLTFQGLDPICAQAVSYPGSMFTDGWENWVLNRKWTESNILWDKDRLRQALRPVLDFQTFYNVPIFVGEFSCARWAPDNSAYRYLRDCIELFDEFNWDWSYHTFRSSDCWSVEHTTAKFDYSPSPFKTDRFLLLQSAFQRK
jgi:endoglucanase